MGFASKVWSWSLGRGRGAGPGRRRLGLCAVALAAASLLSPARASASSQDHELPDTCYLFAYFFHHEQERGFRLAWSPDGFAWTPLNGERPMLDPAVGESKLMRDPCLMRAPDGVFHLVWTTGWRGKTIGHASSRDLVTWSEQQAIPVMAHESQTVNCWAPEVVWVPEQQHFLVHWSSTILGKFPETADTNRGPERNHRIYATTTRDFATFSPTKLLYDGGFNVIDSNLVPDGAGGWLLFAKNEQLTPVTEKNIRLARAPTPEGPYSPPSPPLTGNYWAEGPSAIRIGDAWHLYFDKHRANAIGLLRSTDLEHWEDLSDRVSFPRDARHGCVIAVPRSIVERLLQLGASRSDAPEPVASVVSFTRKPHVGIRPLNS